MRSANPQLIALLDSNQFVMADLFTITTVLGDVYRFTNYDFPLTISGNTYESGGIIIDRSELSQSIGLEVDSLQVNIKANNESTLGSIPFMKLLHNGGLDGARFRLERVFLDVATPTDTSAGSIQLFNGRVSEVDFSRYEASLSIAHDIELLNVQLPRNLYQPACLNTLFDGGCKLLSSGYAVNTSVAAGSSLSRIECTMSQPQGYFNQGVIEFISGVNTGVKRTIKRHESGVIILTLPLRSMPTIGDEIRLYPGCDKRMETCDNRFNNLTNFRGFPFVPVPETAV